jgi:hypothetical protein
MHKHFSKFPHLGIGVCTGKENYFDQQFRPIPSVAKKSDKTSLIEFLKLFVCTQ